MTKDEFRTKITNIMDEAIKIDKIECIVKDMDKSMSEELSSTTREALSIGYSEMLRKAYNEIRYIWLHLYDLRKDVEGEPTEAEISKVREVIGDD